MRYRVYPVYLHFVARISKCHQLLQHYPFSLEQTPNTNQRFGPASRLAILHQHTNLCFYYLTTSATMALNHRRGLGHGTNTLAHFFRWSIRGKGALNEVKLGLVGHAAILANACASRALI